MKKFKFAFANEFLGIDYLSFLPYVLLVQPLHIERGINMYQQWSKEMSQPRMISSINAHVQPLHTELSTSMSQEGTKDTLKLSGNSCFSFVSGVDHGDSPKTLWFLRREEASYPV